MNSRNRRMWLALLATTASTVALLPGGVAAAAPSADAPERTLVSSEADLYRAQGVTAGTLALMKTQERLDRLADQIRTAGARAATAQSGLAGLVVEPENNVLRMYWHGTTPAAVTDVIAKGRATGITVRTASAPYTDAQLQAEIARMVKQSASAGATGRRVVEASAKPDGTGINVTVSGLPTGVTTAAARAAVPALNSAIPLTVTAGEGLRVATRYLDSPAYWGGAYITNGSEGCSDAFGVTGNNGAATYMLSAWHCGMGTGTWRTGKVNYTDGTSEQNTLGSVISTNAKGNDGEAILTNEGSDGAVYYGTPINPPNGDLGTYSGIAVAGSAGSTIGDLVCTSGSYTGTVCSIRVAATGVTISPTDQNGTVIATFTNMINAQLPGVSVAGNGDSGGPVFAIRTTDQRAIARGVISSISTTTTNLRPCTGYVYTGRQCSQSVYYGDITRIMSTIGVHINVY